MSSCRTFERVMLHGRTLAVVALLVPLASVAIAQTPTELLPLAGDRRVTAAAINTRGVVAGTSFSGGGLATAVMWDRQGRPKALRPLDGDRESSASAINARGQIAGTSTAAGGTSTAVMWNTRGKPKALPPLVDDRESSAAAINPRGEVAGTSTAAGGLTLAVLWNRKGKPTALPPLFGDRRSAAFEINARGEVLGFSFGAGGTTPVVWRRGSGQQQDTSAGALDGRIAPNPLIERIEERSPALSLSPASTSGGSGVSIIVVE